MISHLPAGGALPLVGEGRTTTGMNRMQANRISNNSGLWERQKYAGAALALLLAQFVVSQWTCNYRPLVEKQELAIGAWLRTRTTRVGLEVARSPRELAIGLMNRPFLAADRGMLFEFDSPQSVAFWMRDTLIPLDMVFIRDGVVVAVADRVPPCRTWLCPTYGPQALVDSVIELKAGSAARLGLHPGKALRLEVEVAPAAG